MPVDGHRSDRDAGPGVSAVLDEFPAFLKRALPAWKAEHGADYASNDDRSRFEARRAWQRALDAEGWAAIGWPVEFGGRGASLEDRVAYDVLLAEHGAPMIAGVLGVRNVGPAVIAYGTDDQKAHLPSIRRGDEIWVQGFSEPGAGSDLASLQCRACAHGDGFIVDGQKTWTSSAMFADYCQLLVRTDGSGKGHKGISCLLVPMETPGITVRPIRQLTGESEFGEVFFDGASVPRGALLGPVGHGWAVAITTLAHERAGTLALQANLRQYVDDALLRARLSSQAGAPVDAVLRRRLIGLYERVTVMRGLGQRGVDAAGGGVPGPEGSIIKLIWSQAHRDMGEVRLAELAGEGPAWSPDREDSGDRDVRYMFLRSRSATIAAGTSEVLRNIVAERVLGLPPEPRPAAAPATRS